MQSCYMLVVCYALYIIMEANIREEQKIILCYWITCMNFEWHGMYFDHFTVTEWGVMIYYIAMCTLESVCYIWDFFEYKKEKKW